MNRNYGKLKDGALTYAPNNIRIGDTIYAAPTAAQYLTCGWKPVSASAPSSAAPAGWHYEADGWEEAADGAIVRTWKTVQDAAVVRTFSKLKAVKALMAAGYWARCKAYIEDAGLYDLYLAAQDFREDDDAFVQGLTRIKAELALTDAQVEAILAQCVADDAEGVA